MEKQVQIFNNPDFGDIRVVVINGDPWFVVADACRALDLGNTAQALSRIKEDEKGIITNDTPGGPQKMLIVNEPGLYRLIFSSRKPEAEKFQHVVYHDILPSIRKTGGYQVSATNYKDLAANPDFIIAMGQALKAEQEKVARLSAQKEMLLEENCSLNQQIAEMEPKATYYDVVLQCPEVVPIKVVAADYGMSAVKMNRILSELKVQYKQGDTWYLYHKYAELGWTKTKTHRVPDKEGQEHARTHTYWTQKGRYGIYEVLKAHGYLPLIEQEDENVEEE